MIVKEGNLYGVRILIHVYIFLKVMFQFEFVLHVHILRWNKTDVNNLIDK